MSDVTWLTQAAYDRLVAELAEREGSIRQAISEKIGKARDEGDLKENAGYHAAKEEQGQNEARIKQIRHLLEHAQVGSPDAHPDEVAPGRVITVYLDLLDEEQTFFLGSREDAAHAELEVYSTASPLGQAILGKHVGDEATYKTPNGKQLRVTIVKVELA